jgi:uncharacterized protein YgiM (DUF1202 family)
MAARRLPVLLTPCLLAAAALALATPVAARAQEAGGDSPTVAPEVPNAKFNFVGEINGNSVYVRSGPSDSYYPTTKLSKGTRVIVRGVKFDYLKIEPPAGSFSYVGKAYVERRGEAAAGVGRVTTAANVRTGSELNSMKTTVQTKLDAGTDVKILGEQDEYFKIEPPQGAYLYVKKDFVTPKERVPAEGEGIAAATPDQQNQAQAPAQPQHPEQAARPPADDTTGAAGAIADAATGQGQPAEPTSPATGHDGAAPTTEQTSATADAKPQSGGTGTATRPADSQPVTADAKFEKIEGEFEAASQKPIVEQPIDELLGSYQALVKDDSLPESLKRLADARIAALKVRKQTREEFLVVRKNQEEMENRRKALQAERQELEEQIKATNVEFYAAVGTLRTSSLQQGPKGTTLYRLTDPQTGRTLVYIRSADRETSALLNQFVGVKGELRSDPLLRMKVITPTEATPVDQTKVGTTVAAGVLPPSLLRSTPTVSTENTPLPGE